ncbi:D-ribose transporter subunit RbsB [Lactiplantibacillus fabifermentans T30PCM01]|uniref:D-ribose transporter subunit RbsB n=1 Tax=Lactiplantibacillus fabifermentans T30PCM01 TaxID=1400520 RepID=W6TBI5_9LACO|nr:substrate-binding domain-containing protein [Lactiplantibacillus fabifermentans]ETY72700.1 D-ribose transporter subunit RbsB [Lactiplantibacillus fabifermentans T30PCM01]
MKFSFKRLLTIGAVVLLSVGALAGCGGTGLSSGTSSTTKTEKKKPNKLTVGVSISTLSNPAFIVLKNKIEDYAKKNGTKVQITDAQNDTAKQNNDVEDFIQKKVDAIIVNPCDSSAIAPEVKSANKAGIPVVCVDRSSDGGKVLTTVASDSVKGGKMAAQYLTKLVGKNAKIAEITGIPGASATRERGKGFDTEAKGNLKIVTKQTAGFDRAKALTVAENIIQAHPEIKAIFAQNDEMAVGAAKAVSGSSNKKIKVVGFDGAEAYLKMIKNGQGQATIAQRWDLMGTLSLDAIYDHYQGKKVQKSIKSPIKLTTKANVK